LLEVDCNIQLDLEVVSGNHATCADAYNGVSLSSSSRFSTKFKVML